MKIDISNTHIYDPSFSWPSDNYGSWECHNIVLFLLTKIIIVFGHIDYTGNYSES